jgi:CheY-like chemotaxis protein
LVGAFRGSVSGSAEMRRNLENCPNAPVVLLVEDEWLLRMDVADALRNDGLVVIEAGSGEAALACLHTGQHIDLLVTDIQLTGKVDGWDVARAFRASSADKPVIYASGAPREERREVRGSCFFGKPYQTADLVAACHDLGVN